MEREHAVALLQQPVHPDLGHEVLQAPRRHSDTVEVHDFDGYQVIFTTVIFELRLKDFSERTFPQHFGRIILIPDLTLDDVGAYYMVELLFRGSTWKPESDI